jgi:two-component system cell cycle sensor histidine kinase/response regulator CckA
MQNHSLARSTSRGRPQSDVTEASEQLAVTDAERLQVVGRLASGVAHEFNNLLSVILSSARLAREALPASHPSRQDIDEVLGAAERAQSLTQKLLSLGRRKVVTPELVSPIGLLEGMQRMLRHLLPESVGFRLDIERKLGLIRVDPTCFELVVLNLVANARDAMPSGGELVLTARRGRSPAERVGGAQSFVLEVQDQGIGMNDEVRAHAFEPFYTTKALGAGTGLGLATVRDIVTQAGGTIEVDSRVGNGSTFRVCLPRFAEGGSETRARSRPRSSTRIRARRETVLLVEDDPRVRRLFRRLLERSGYTVLEAGSALQAVELAEREAGKIHLMITDVVMPVMTGGELADLVAQVRPDTRVLFVSGYRREDLERRGGLRPGGQLVEKPVTPEALARAVRQALDEPR